MLGRDLPITGFKDVSKIINAENAPKKSSKIREIMTVRAF
jgi:hypothetical protein